MPKLKQYADGRGFYLSGHIPDVGFCTWQIGREGLAYLAGRGIAANGDTLRIDDLRDMLARGLAGTACGGTSPTPAAPPPQWVRPLADGLVAWSLSGGVDTLARIVCPGSGAAADARPRCFPVTLLTWLGELDSDAGLVQFSGMSPAEFEALAVDVADELSEDPLFGHLIDRGAVGVLWRLSRLAGSVAVRVRAGAKCPAEWRNDALLCWLFSRVKECEDSRRASPRSAGPRRPVGWAEPRLVWAVDLQEVTALLPGQLLPMGVTGVEWRVGRGTPIHPLARPGPRGRQIEESVSEPLPPADVYVVELVPAGGTPGRTRWTIGYPAESAVVLFHTDGRLVDAEGPDPLPPGRYLALVRPGHESSARALRGFSLVEKVPVGPIGWSGWSGWSVDLSPGATVPGYLVADAAQAIRWEADPPPDAGVSWLDSCPVFLGEFPRIRLAPAEAFRGAVVEVVVAGAGGIGGEPIYLTMGRDVPVQASGGTCVADLNAVPRLKSLLGRFLLKCQPAGRLDQSPLVLVFTLLPKMGLEYVPDPQRPTAATALRVIANEARIGVTPGPDTEVLPEPAGAGPSRFVVRSMNPESAPGVHVRSRAADWEMRVRIGVSRACLVSGQAGFQGWRQVPFGEIDLARVGLGDRLRIEFHTPPVTEDGRLVTRLPGRGTLLVGEPLDRSATPTVFEIPLHRWRDGFGIGSCGVIQVRGGAGWVGAARLVSSDPVDPAPAVSPPAETWWQQLTSELDQAVARGDNDTASDLITRCLGAANGPSVTASASDLLPLAAARAALVVQSPSEWVAVRSAVGRLQGRGDLPEAEILAIELDLRGVERLASAGKWSLARVEEIEARLPNDSGAAGVRAECWYRLARSAGGPALGCWRACADWAGRYLTAGLPETGIAFSDAVLLLDLARMMLGHAPAAGPIPAGLLQGHRGWVEAVRYADRFMRRPWHGGADSAYKPDLSCPAPSVLCLEDEALIRVVVGVATGRGERAQHWCVVAGLADGYFYALPLLRARYARYASDGTADEEYAQAWAAFVSGDDADMLDVIAAERP
ncbi:MAG: hypothetical protein JWO38_2848 [Gemmataceae bacterium]|nr:hypothetical protein [Gemmataceae bacterium]